jgi:hypothetical protein
MAQKRRGGLWQSSYALNGQQALTYAALLAGGWGFR